MRSLALLHGPSRRSIGLTGRLTSGLITHVWASCVSTSATIVLRRCQSSNPSWNLGEVASYALAATSVVVITLAQSSQSVADDVRLSASRIAWCMATLGRKRPHFRIGLRGVFGDSGFPGGAAGGDGLALGMARVLGRVPIIALRHGQRLPSRNADTPPVSQPDRAERP